jgi:large subunit ribosomal protein MRP49
MLEITLKIDSGFELPTVSEHQPVEFVCAAPAGRTRARLELAIDGQALEPFLRPGETAWRWRWNPGPAVGLHRATLLLAEDDAGETGRSWSLRVLARKIDQERYEALLDDMPRRAYGLAYTLAGAGAESAELQREAPWASSPAETFYALFEERLDTFERAVRRIAQRPREHLRGTREQQPLGQAGSIGEEALAGLARGPFDEAPADVAAELQAALRPGGGYLPRSVPAARGRPTTDIYEHRLLKHLLLLLLRRARFVGRLAEHAAARLAAREAYSGEPSTRRLRAEQIAAGCAAAERALRELRALPFLAEVRPLPAFRGATPLLQRDAAYREIYRMWQAQRQHPYLAFDSPLFSIPIADLPRLYEGWCAIQVASALLELGGEVREQRLVARREPGAEEDELELAVSLVEDAPLLVIDRGGSTFTLRYQPHYRPRKSDERRAMSNLSRSASALVAHHSSLVSLDRHTRVPDLAIEIRREGEPPRALLLDAKYRLDAEGRGVPQDALADAYTYRGAIGLRNTAHEAGAPPAGPATLGALLLYPGTGEPEFYPSGVGAVPLLPGRSEQLAQALASWLP